MKELDPPTIAPSEQVAYIPKELKGMGEINKPHLGMKLFGFNMETMEVTEVKYHNTTLPVMRIPANKDIINYRAMIQKEIHHQVVFDKSCWYVWAVNEKNARRKFLVR